jgi:tetratricopeptide (TPR) repeat protein
LIDTVLPPDTHVAVVSRGDEELLHLGYRLTCHFPETGDGRYAGSYPEDSAAALQALEALREREVDYLVFPSTAFWWLDYYEDFRTQLERTFATVVKRDDTCRVYALSGTAAARARKVRPDAAATSAAATLELDEGDLRLELASRLLSHERASEAADVLADGLAHAPDSARLHAAMMRCAAALGDRARADHHASDARGHAGDDLTANRELAEAAWAIGRLSLAEECLLQLVELAPTERLPANRLVLLLCARALKTPGRSVVDRLVAQTRMLTTRRLLEPDTLFRAAEILERFDRPDEALECLGGVLAQAPLDAGARRTLADRLLQPTEVDPPHDDPRALAAMLTLAGNSFTALHDERRAEACWQLTRLVKRQKAAAAFNLAWRAIDSGRPLEAIEQLTDFQRIDSGEAAMICWPRVRDLPWPRAALRGTDGFESLKPAGATWPRVTVVTPSLDQAPHVEDAILSVLNQGYPDLEYIVVDGGSTDGTQQILRRYERKLAHLIVEPNGGRSDAVNKGLQLATGSLVTCLNADDMLAPGALFVLAAAHLSSGADLVAGLGLEHAHRRFETINLPAVVQETFNVSSLGALFDYWLKAHYFSQPQVVFTRRLLGGAAVHDEYDLWLRFADAGATVSVAPFPVALFRKHSEETTMDFDATVIELANIRKAYTTPGPTFGRSVDVRRRLRRALSQPRPRIHVVSTRASKIFAAETGRELEESCRQEGLEVSFGERLDPALVNETDLVILLMHLMEEEPLRELRQRGCEVPVVGWTWDNHHDVHRNYRCAENVDVLVPGHAFAGEYLRSTRYLMGESRPLCVTQWTAGEAKRFFHAFGRGERRDSLSGGFVRYGFADKRNGLVEELQRAGVEGVGFIEEDALETYFGVSPGERFAQWAAHKTSLCVPLSGDLSQRLFDALLTGQVPLVPPDLHDLDAVVPPALQKRLPIVRFEEYSAAAVREAHRAALELFDRDGPAGARRRHRYALANHMFKTRIASVLLSVRRRVAEQH